MGNKELTLALVSAGFVAISGSAFYAGGLGLAWASAGYVVFAGLIAALAGWNNSASASFLSLWIYCSAYLVVALVVTPLEAIRSVAHKVLPRFRTAKEA